jgi:hypothetical protein
MTDKNVYVDACDLGFGVFAGRAFAANEFIIRFTGPQIDLQAALAKGEKQGNPLQIGDGIYLDPQPPCVFINHSCDPNAGIRNSTELYALRNIRVGEEIRFDYSTSILERCWTMECRCGSPACRQIVRDFDQLPYDLQQSYLSRQIVQPFIVDMLRGIPAPSPYSAPAAGPASAC